MSHFEICKFCNSKFKSISSLNHHQKTAKYCLIKRGKIVIVDFVATDKNAYKDIKIKLKYLGKGVYHSYGDHPANDPKKYHFWKKETDNTKQ